MQGFSVMWGQAPQNGRHHRAPRSIDVVRSGASSPAIKKRYCLVQIVKVHSMSVFVYSVSGLCFKLEILCA